MPPNIPQTTYCNRGGLGGGIANICYSLEVQGLSRLRKTPEVVFRQPPNILGPRKSSMKIKESFRSVSLGASNMNDLLPDENGSMSMGMILPSALLRCGEEFELKIAVVNCTKLTIASFEIQVLETVTWSHEGKTRSDEYYLVKENICGQLAESAKPGKTLEGAVLFKAATERGHQQISDSNRRARAVFV